MKKFKSKIIVGDVIKVLKKLDRDNKFNVIIADPPPNLEINQIREPYTDNYLKLNGKERANTKGRFGNKTTTYKVNGQGALPRDVITIPTLAGGAGMTERYFVCKDCNKNLYPPSEKKNHENHSLITHPTQKPIQLTEKLIFSRINGNKGRILIPFAGSGSECVVAEMNNIEYLGIEINPEYVEGHDVGKDVQIRETNGKVNDIQIKSGKVKKSNMVVSGHRTGRFKGDLNKIKEFLNSNKYDTFLIPYRKEEDKLGRRFVYKIFYADSNIFKIDND
ncbi:S-adenosyl-L-methionine-dependent methyltransferase [Glomus cerebriforme]|uniref:S-adenosyl-L-methionine-dependent methyltransferase n=1 Tax=Glomus cerebriforme TaxID=658196 RepID=A0A397T4V8_9GLOM|nr:S-adenosyl-L-methionine-dependent methyltransferase [Glomus cerebriforme]